jgi:hypothetical protein
MIEFHTGLHDGGDHTGPRGAEARPGKDDAMRVDGRACRLRRGHCNRAQVLGRAAGRGHLGADDIDRRLPARARMGAFGYGAQTRAAPRNHLV